MKIPLKNQIFAWYLRRGEIPTKYNIAKQIGMEKKRCVFCNHDETIKHLLLVHVC
jgi:hypothetical protein